MTRLPWEKGLGEIPQGVKRARKLTVPPRKASYFPTSPCPSNVKDPFISKLSLPVMGDFL
ncbi:hypothetical protein CEH05_00400 [Halobacillus halophilus]|nr:hypothetical protein CEH05_00400 [Halobacillus halophilus]